MQEDASDTESCIVPEIKMTRESLALYQLCADEDLNRIMMIMIRRSRKLREIILYSAYIINIQFGQAKLGAVSVYRPAAATHEAHAFATNDKDSYATSSEKDYIK